MAKIRILIMFLMLVLVLTLPYSTVAVIWAQPASKASTDVVSGPKKIALLLFDFENIKHTRTPDYYQKIVKDMNASYYRQSYGKMWLVGGEVYGWYATDLHVGKITTWDVDWHDAEALEKYALVKAGSLRIADRYLFAVYAGNIWAWSHIGGKMTVIGETRWDLRTFMHEFGHNLGLPDLYNYFNLDAEPVGEWDLMDSGEEELSCWSRVKLGWIPSDSVLKTYSGREVTVFISSLDSANGTRVMKVQLGGGSTRYLLVETRQTDKGLQLVIYRIEGGVESGKGSIVLEAVMNPKSKPVFFDTKVNAAFIILDMQTAGLSVRLAKQGEGEKAQEAYDAATSASESIETAWSENRIQGLDEAKQELSRAWEAFYNADFDAARGLAVRAGQSAQDASVPQSYSQVVELRQTLQAQVQNASTYRSDEAINYLSAAKNLMKDADELVYGRDFDGALQKLQEAQKDLVKASEAEKASTIETQSTQTALSQFSSYQIIIVAAVVVIAIIVAVLFVRQRRAEE